MSDSKGQLKLADVRSLFAAISFIRRDESVAFFSIKPFDFSCNHELSSYATIIKDT